jgi:hypothetical protein
MWLLEMKTVMNSVAHGDPNLTWTSVKRSATLLELIKKSVEQGYRDGRSFLWQTPPSDSVAPGVPPEMTDTNEIYDVLFCKTPLNRDVFGSRPGVAFKAYRVVDRKVDEIETEEFYQVSIERLPSTLIEPNAIAMVLEYGTDLYPDSIVVAGADAVLSFGKRTDAEALVARGFKYRGEDYKATLRIVQSSETCELSLIGLPETFLKEPYDAISTSLSVVHGLEASQFSLFGRVLNVKFDAPGFDTFRKMNLLVDSGIMLKGVKYRVSKPESGSVSSKFGLASSKELIVANVPDFLFEAPSRFLDFLETTCGKKLGLTVRDLQFELPSKVHVFTQNPDVLLKARIYCRDELLEISSVKSTMYLIFLVDEDFALNLHTVKEAWDVQIGDATDLEFSFCWTASCQNNPWIDVDDRTETVETKCFAVFGRPELFPKTVRITVGRHRAAAVAESEVSDFPIVFRFMQFHCGNNPMTAAELLSSLEKETGSLSTHVLGNVAVVYAKDEQQRSSLLMEEKFWISRTEEENKIPISQVRLRLFI